jgi:outer membrane lipoprotein-sorting protein
MPRFITRSALLLAAALLTMPPQALAAEQADLQRRLRQLVDTVETATWSHDIWMTNGSKEQHTQANVWWSAGQRVRVDVVGGDDKGGTAVMEGTKVTGFRRGMLSFAKLSFDVNDKMVCSVRGQSMQKTGFFHHIRHILAHWDDVRLSLDNGDAIFDFTNDEGHPTRLWLRVADLHVHRIEVREAGKLVEKHAYSKIRYAANLPEDIFNP